MAKKKAAQIKITQIKSQIKRPQKQKDTLLALGLGKINRTRIVEDTPQTQGMIHKVAHMLSIEKIS
jgi:large subunit ribosomal protein L30